MQALYATVSIHGNNPVPVAQPILLLDQFAKLIALDALPNECLPLRA
jgi:hypothetical protein